MSTLQAVKPKERIESLDLLRGFAILGILIMNIISFSNIGIGYLNPTVGAGIEGYNAWVYGFSHLFADMRFMSTFSILFGAGVVLFAENAKRKQKNVAKYHYRRMFLLLIAGMMHAYLIWMGDILVAYAICGSIVFLMRNLKIRTLYIIGTVFFIIPILFSLSTYYFTPEDQLEKIFSFWTPSQEEVTKEISAYRGSYLDQMEPRVEGAIMLQTTFFLMEQMWRVISMMLLGMILFKKGILSAKMDSRFYMRLIVVGLGLGLIISGSGLYRSYQVKWNGAWYMNIGHQYNYIASILMALGYIGIIMLWAKSSIYVRLKMRFEAAGRMAFTNYILSSIICTLIFYGHGLGLFAMFDRLQQWGVVLVVWAIILLISPTILKKFKQGPLEWLWRKFTYWG